jgi:hypothetical protein
MQREAEETKFAKIKSKQAVKEKAEEEKRSKE